MLRFEGFMALACLALLSNVGQTAAAEPVNLATKAKVSASAEYSGRFLAKFAVDGKAPMPFCREMTTWPGAFQIDQDGGIIVHRQNGLLGHLPLLHFSTAKGPTRRGSPLLSGGSPHPQHGLRPNVLRRAARRAGEAGLCQPGTSGNRSVTSAPSAGPSDISIRPP